MMPPIVDSSPGVVSRQTWLTACDALLAPERFKDYGPNGLQVEGKADIRHVVSGVTASLALIDAAIADGADAIFVHHGLFWRGQDGRVVGWMKQRLARLLAHDINLFAYHLPLDAHPTLGNNAQLVQRLGLSVTGAFGDQDVGLLAAAPDAGFDSTDALAARVAQVLGRQPLLLDPLANPHSDPNSAAAPSNRAKSAIKNIAICSGGAQSFFESAIAAGADAFITGEISEPQAHLARECGVAYLACGHHATERFGAPAVAAHLAARFGVTHRFIDIPNPA